VAQEVFLRVFDDRVLERADARRGRFRSLLLAVTRHVIGHHFEREHAAKRGGGRVPVPLAGAALDAALSEDERDQDFDREWVASLLREALGRLKSENKSYHACLNSFIVEERSHKEIARTLGKTDAAVRNAISRGRARLGAILRELIAAYSSSEGELADEVAYLSRFLRSPKSP
jgi:RNA polymerase sigma-70 factor (ECF subfamily)